MRSILLSLVGNAIQAFGNGTDVGVWQPQPPLQPTAEPSITRRGKAQTNNAVDTLTDVTKMDLNRDSYHICGTLQVKFEKPQYKKIKQYRFPMWFSTFLLTADLGSHFPVMELPLYILSDSEKWMSAGFWSALIWLPKMVNVHLSAAKKKERKEKKKALQLCRLIIFNYRHYYASKCNSFFCR